MGLTEEDLEAIERKFDEEDPTPSMFDAIFAKVEKVVREQFKVWQSSLTAHKRAKSASKGNEAALDEAGDDTEAASEKVGQQPSNVTNQRLLKKFGAVPTALESSPAKKK